MSVETSIIKDLRDKNIGFEGEEFYAVMCGYLVKIAELSGKEMEVPTEVLKLAARCQVSNKKEDKQALQDALKGLVEDQNELVKKVVLNDGSNRGKIEALHSIAMVYGDMRDYQETVSRCRKFTAMNERLEHEKFVYKEGYESFVALSQIKYNEEALESIIKMRAGSVQTPLDAIKATILENITQQEDNFLKLQAKFVNKTVSFLVDDRCRIAKHKKLEESLLDAQVS